MSTLDYILKKYEVTETGLVKLECTRWGTLPKLFRELGSTVGVEVGTYAGRFAKFLAEHNPTSKLYVVDAWEIYPGYEDITTKEEMDIVFADAKNRLAPYPNVQFIRDWSNQAVRRFADESLDYVYIDANHSYEAAKEDLAIWSKKVKKGGIISGHDYINGHRGITFGVKQAVNEFVKEHNISHLFVLIKGANKDQMPSWMIVKTW